MSKRPRVDMHASPFALTNRQLRTLAFGYALFQAVTVAGTWTVPIASLVPRWHGPWMILATAAALAGAVFFLWRAIGNRPITRQEGWVFVAIAFNFLWPGLVTTGGLMGRLLMDEDAAGAMVFSFMYVGFVHGTTALLLYVSFGSRRGATDADWRAHQSDTTGRAGALLGVSILVGGWTAAAGVGLYLLWSISFIDLDDLVWLSLALGGGMAAGFVMALFTATLPSDTRLNKTVPVLFGSTFVIGVLASVVHPALGAMAAAVTAFGMSFVVRVRYPLFELGKCQQCAYDLRGLGEPVCPECGYTHRPDELPRGGFAKPEAETADG